MQVSIPIDLNVAVKQLPLREKLRLLRALEQETWAARLNEVVGRIRARPSVQALSARALTRLVEEVRQARYARASRRP